MVSFYGKKAIESLSVKLTHYFVYDYGRRSIRRMLNLSLDSCKQF